MSSVTDPFDFTYDGSEVRYGRGRAAALGEVLDHHDLNRVLLVCGQNVGSNNALMEPICRGLGERLINMFDETTPEKRIDTVYDGIEAAADASANVLIAVGGGSSLDTARQISALSADGRPQSAFVEAAHEGKAEPVAAGDDAMPVIVIPTTFAGAGLSSGGSVEILPALDSPTGRPIRTYGRVQPSVIVFDPDCFETTPMGPLAGSVMNGFNKGIETVYSRGASAVTDATAVRGLRLLSETAPRLPEDDPEVMDRAVLGLVLVQFRRRTSLIHAIGHGFARRYPVQQGAVHAAAATHALDFLFNRVGGRRRVLAEAFDVDPDASSDAVASAIVESVAAVRDAFDLPAQFGDLKGTDPADRREIAEAIVNDRVLDCVPEALEVTVDDLESLLEVAW